MMICWYALTICLKDILHDYPVLSVHGAPETPERSPTPPCFDLLGIGLNECTSRLPPQEAVRFGVDLHRTLCRIVGMDLHLVPVYIGKLYLDDSYMSL